MFANVDLYKYIYFYVITPLRFNHYIIICQFFFYFAGERHHLSIMTPSLVSSACWSRFAKLSSVVGYKYIDRGSCGKGVIFN